MARTKQPPAFLSSLANPEEVKLQLARREPRLELRGRLVDLDEEDEHDNKGRLKLARCKPQLELRGRLVDLDDEDDDDGHDKKKVDPMEVLDENLMKHMLSFLGCGRGCQSQTPLNHPILPTKKKQEERALGGQELGLLESVRLYSFLASVSKTWNSFIQKCWSEESWLIHANFQSEERWTRSKRRNCVLWLVRNKIPLGSLQLALSEQEVPLFTQLLQDCPTTRLLKCHICLIKPLSSYGSSGSRHLRGGGVARQRSQGPNLFLDFIARQCPNLEEVCLPSSSLLLENHQRGSSSRSSTGSSLLFSMPSIKRLHLGGLRRSLLGFVARMIAGVPNLQRLELATTAGFCRLIRGGNGVLSSSTSFLVSIHSKSLRALDVTNLGEGAYVTVVCPRLERFVCQRGSGSLPIIHSLDHYLYEIQPHFQRQQKQKQLSWAGGGRGRSILTLPFGTLPFAGVKVPASCSCTMYNLDDYDDSESRHHHRWFQKYQSDLAEVERTQERFGGNIHNVPVML